MSGSVNPGDAMDRQGTGLSGTPNGVPFGSGVPSSQLLADSFYNGIDCPLNQQLGQQSYLFGQSTVPLPPWGQQLGYTLVPAGHPHSQPVGGSYDSRLALLVPGEPGGQQPVGGGWPSYGTSVLFTPVLPSAPLHFQPTPSSLAIMPLGGDMGTLQTKSTTDPATMRLIDDLAKARRCRCTVSSSRTASRWATPNARRCSESFRARKAKRRWVSLAPAGSRVQTPFSLRPCPTSSRASWLPTRTSSSR
mmetsp:Transcript_38029/g.94323  ORF Transcript_38029/g.94323 Transcript_38029/m.94323 type:complete len:248 (-) Transcript_38029:132-875(-)